MAYLAVIGTTEWIVIALVLVLLFGARKLPDLARAMGSSVNEFKKGMSSEPKADDKGAHGTTPGPQSKDH